MLLNMTQCGSGLCMAYAIAIGLTRCFIFVVIFSAIDGVV